MRSEGMLLREIAAELGLSLKTVSEWLSDPDGSKRAARRARYAGVCVDCGRPTDGSDGPGKARERCMACYLAHLHANPPVWGRDRIVQCIRVWADEHGGIPPCAEDWNPSFARRRGRLDKAEKFERDGCWPYVNSVQQWFGSWGNAIRAAGFEPHMETGGHDDFERTVRLYEHGLSVAEIAERERRHPNTINWRLRRMGVNRRRRAA